MAHGALPLGLSWVVPGRLLEGTPLGWFSRVNPSALVFNGDGPRQIETREVVSLLGGGWVIFTDTLGASCSCFAPALALAAALAAFGLVPEPRNPILGSKRRGCFQGGQFGVFNRRWKGSRTRWQGVL